MECLILSPLEVYDQWSMGCEFELEVCCLLVLVAQVVFYGIKERERRRVVMVSQL